MARDVDQLSAAAERGEHVATAAHQVIDEVRDAALVPGDLPRAEDDEVALRELHGGMLAEGEPGKRGAGLSLRSRAEDDELAGREVIRCLGIHEQVGRAIEISEVESETHVLLD